MCRPRDRDSPRNSVNGTGNVPTTLTSVGHAQVDWDIENVWLDIIPSTLLNGRLVLRHSWAAKPERRKLPMDPTP